MYRTEVVQAYSAYLPQDRLAQLGGGGQVPERGAGAVLFADVVGFTGLTTRLAELYGPRRGAEEVPVYLNRLYEALSGEVDERGGSVVGFAGDAITCWFPGDDGAVAVACGLAMQAAMAPFNRVALAGAARGQTISLALKVSVSAGNVRRFVVGDPGIQLIDVIAGGPVAQIEALESVVQRGQVVVSAAVAEAVKAHVRLLPVEAPPAEGAGAQGARLVALPASAGRSAALRGPSRPAPPEAGAVARWLLPTVQRRLSAGAGEFLTELRPVAALFLSFDGIDLDADPEAPAKFNQVVCAAQQAASDYGGNVLQVSSGDKGNYLYMAFGAPVSHENDVQRCAAAALDLRDALTGLRFLTRVSIGLGYGTARTGAYGSESRRTYGALGEGTNMAARMMGKAGNGQIFVSEAFADALPAAFHLAELPSLLVKGRAEPVRAFELLAGTGPVAPAPQAGLGQLVGREEELAFLRAQLHAAAQGEGRIVQLVADAGMGKSELLKHALAGGGPVEVVRGACQAFGRTAPYRLWKSVFHRLLGLDEGSPASQRVTATYHALGAIDGSLTAQADLLAPILDLPLRSSQGAAEDAGNALDAEDAEARNSARRTLLLNIFRSAARRAAADGRPLVLFLEDLHWLDPASEELLVALGPIVPALPVLVLTASRPAEVASEPAPGTLEGASTLQLGPLGRTAAEEVVRSRLRAAGLGSQAATLVLPIVERSGGNPFYLQELVTDLIHRAGSGGVPAGVGDLPTSLHSLLLGRIDRLTEFQQVNLKMASVVGREFRTSWVAACQPRVESGAVMEAFVATDAVGLTAKLSPEPPVHEFNHAITHEVAYESQSHSGRTKQHTRLARFIEDEVATPAEPHLDLLAYHYSLGNDEEKARTYLGAAGAAAKAAYANQAALRYFRRLLELQAAAERLPTLLELGEVESFVGSYADAEEHLAEALTLAREHGLRQQEAGALRRLGELHERQGEHGAARGPLEQAAHICRELGDDAELTRVLLALGGNVLWHLGEYAAAEAQLEEAVTLARAAGDDRSAARALHGVANIHYDKGDVGAAARILAESLALRRSANDDYGVANALNNLAVLHATTGEGGQAEELFAESLAIRQRLGDTSGVAVALNNLGYMAGERGDLSAARRLYEESLATRRELGDKLGLAVSLSSLAELYLRLDERGEARGAYLESARLAADIGNGREFVGALAGLARAVEERPVAERLALVADVVIRRFGVGVEAEVREQLDRVLTPASEPGPPAHASTASLAELLEWALHGLGR